MNFDAKIPNIESYNERMRKSMIDKIFFFDKFDADIYVDYGCGNGDLIKFMQILFPEKTYIGYDINQDMMRLAFKKIKGAVFFDDFDHLRAHLTILKQNKPEAKIAVICNSLIHEVYAYGSSESVKLFWEEITNPIFDFIVVRDMCVSKSVVRKSDVLNVFKIRQRFDDKMLEEFERHWGSIDQNWSLVHFLLKYRYKENWDREVKENYLPLDLETLTKCVVGFNPLFVEHYTLPYIRRTVEEDFDVQLQDCTHIKLILERKR